MYLFSSHLYRFKMHQLILLALFLSFSVAVDPISLDRRAEVLLGKVKITTFIVENHIPLKRVKMLVQNVEILYSVAVEKHACSSKESRKNADTVQLLYLPF